MSDYYTKQLTFSSNDLGADATLVLTFDKPVDGLFRDKFPVVLKTFAFPAADASIASITYRNQLGFLQAQVASDTTIVGSASQVLEPSETTTLVEVDGGFSWTNPVPGSVGYYGAVNGTSQNVDVALGFAQNPGQPLTPALYWNALSPAASTQAQFSPVLRAYITDQYRDQQLIRGEIPSSLLFEQDLSTLDDRTNWVLSYDANTGAFAINLS
jgi:hypothetical protein